MQVDVARKRLDALELKILEMLQTFEADSGTCVKAIELDGCQVRTIGSPVTRTALMRVQVRVEL